MQLKISSKLDFIGIGTGKAGSSWLWEQIVAHPEISSGNPKEINFFSSLYETQNLNWYLSHFEKTDEKKKGEFSVTYIDHPEAPGRILSDLGSIKIICVLRNPINRIYSDYKHSQRKGVFSSQATFDEYIVDEKRLLFGKYSSKLKNWIELFRRENVHVIFYEDIMNEKKKGLKKLYTFIGVNDSFIPESMNEYVNQGKEYKFIIFENLISSFSRLLTNSGHLKFLETLKKTNIHKFLRGLNSKQEIRHEIQSEDKQKLIEYFKKDVFQLFQQLNVNNIYWKDFF